MIFCGFTNSNIISVISRSFFNVISPRDENLDCKKIKLYEKSDTFPFRINYFYMGPLKVINFNNIDYLKKIIIGPCNFFDMCFPDSIQEHPKFKENIGILEKNFIHGDIFDFFKQVSKLNFLEVFEMSIACAEVKNFDFEGFYSLKEFSLTLLSMDRSITSMRFFLPRIKKIRINICSHIDFTGCKKTLEEISLVNGCLTNNSKDFSNFNLLKRLSLIGGGTGDDVVCPEILDFFKTSSMNYSISPICYETHIYYLPSIVTEKIMCMSLNLYMNIFSAKLVSKIFIARSLKKLSIQKIHPNNFFETKEIDLNIFPNLESFFSEYDEINIPVIFKSVPNSLKNIYCSGGFTV